MPVLHGSCEDPGNWKQFSPFRVFLWILGDCKASLKNLLTHGERLQSCQFIVASLHYLGEHLCFIPVNKAFFCFWVLLLGWEAMSHDWAAAHLQAWWGGKGWVTIPLTPRCVQYQRGPPPLLRDDKREPVTMHCLCPASWLWSLGRRKSRSFLSVCRQPDWPIVCRWSPAAVSLWAAGQRHRQPWGKGAEGGWPRALLWPVLFPIPCFCWKVLMDNVVSQAVLMWSVAFLLGTIGVLILWFGFFLFSPLFHQ